MSKVTTAKKTTKVRPEPAAAKDKAAKAARSRPLGPFRPTKDGTIRAAVLHLAQDGKTVKEMADLLSTTSGNIGTTFSCIRRDMGVDYDLEKSTGKVTLIFPEGKTLADAIVKAE